MYVLIYFLRKPRARDSTRGLEQGAVDKLLVGIFVFHGEKDKENLPFNLAVDISTLLPN